MGQRAVLAEPGRTTGHTSVYQLESGWNHPRNQGRLTMKLEREGVLIVTMRRGWAWEWRCGRARGSAAGSKCSSEVRRRHRARKGLASGLRARAHWTTLSADFAGSKRVALGAMELVAGVLQHASHMPRPPAWSIFL